VTSSFSESYINIPSVCQLFSCRYLESMIVVTKCDEGERCEVFGGCHFVCLWMFVESTCRQQFSDKVGSCSDFRQFHSST